MPSHGSIISFRMNECALVVAVVVAYVIRAGSLVEVTRVKVRYAAAVVYVLDNSPCAIEFRRRTPNEFEEIITRAEKVLNFNPFGAITDADIAVLAVLAVPYHASF